MRVDVTTYGRATAQIMQWARADESRYVCEAPVHMVMESYDSPEYREIINSADLVTPGGMPIVWMLRRLGVVGQPRVYGPELTLWVCKAAAKAGIPVGFYGGSQRAVESMVRAVWERFEGLDVVYAYSPPFRPLSAKEDDVVTAVIRESGCRILFVGLGCPKQERWMAGHRGRVPAVMLGVGAAFDFISGLKPQAHPWLQGIGLEWAFRLVTEPRRLFFRYFYHNPRFMLLVAHQLGQEMFRKRGGHGSAV